MRYYTPTLSRSVDLAVRTNPHPRWPCLAPDSSGLELLSAANSCACAIDREVKADSLYVPDKYAAFPRLAEVFLGGWIPSKGPIHKRVEGAAVSRYVRVPSSRPMDPPLTSSQCSRGSSRIDIRQRLIAEPAGIWLCTWIDDRKQAKEKLKQ
jgi:hypothetical protein